VCVLVVMGCRLVAGQAQGQLVQEVLLRGGAIWVVFSLNIHVRYDASTPYDEKMVCDLV